MVRNADMVCTTLPSNSTNESPSQMTAPLMPCQHGFNSWLAGVESVYWRTRDDLLASGHAGLTIAVKLIPASARGLLSEPPA